MLQKANTYKDDGGLYYQHWVVILKQIALFHVLFTTGDVEYT